MPATYWVESLPTLPGRRLSDGGDQSVKRGSGYPGFRARSARDPGVSCLGVVLGLSLGCPWVVLGLSLGCPWVVLGISSGTHCSNYLPTVESEAPQHFSPLATFSHP
jgi:hypothetical protein